MTDRAEVPTTLANLQSSAVRLRWERRLEGLLRQAGAPEHVREYHFASEDVGRDFRLDFAWPDRLYAVEVQGGGWMRPDEHGNRRGAHGGGAALERDCEKLTLASALGWHVAAVTPAQIKSGRAVQWILAALEAHVPRIPDPLTEERRARLARVFATKNSPAAWGLAPARPTVGSAPVKARVLG